MGATAGRHFQAFTGPKLGRGFPTEALPLAQGTGGSAPFLFSCSERSDSLSGKWRRPDPSALPFGALRCNGHCGLKRFVLNSCGSRLAFSELSPAPTRAGGNASVWVNDFSKPVSFESSPARPGGKRFPFWAIGIERKKIRRAEALPRSKSGRGAPISPNEALPSWGSNGSASAETSGSAGSASEWCRRTIKTKRFTLEKRLASLAWIKVPPKRFALSCLSRLKRFVPQGWINRSASPGHKKSPAGAGLF